MNELLGGVAPYLFNGGNALDYAIRVGSSGTYNTLHLPTGTAIQSVIPNGGVPGAVSAGLGGALGVAGLAVGIVNLGIGIYTAYQVTQTRRELAAVSRQIGDIAAGQQEIRGDIAELATFSRIAVERVDLTLKQHGAMLGAMLYATDATHDRLDALHDLIASGFVDQRALVLSTAARAVQLEFDARHAESVRHYRALQIALSSGRLPSPQEVGRVIDSATKFIAWSEAARRSMPDGSPTRMPLLVAKAAGLRMLHDARSLEGGADIVSDEKREFLHEVAGEAAMLTEDRSISDLASDLREVLAAYVYLHRALGMQVTVAIDTATGLSVALIDPSEYAWDDGLASVRGRTTPTSGVADAFARHLERTFGMKRTPRIGI